MPRRPVRPRLWPPGSVRVPRPAQAVPCTPGGTGPGSRQALRPYISPSPNCQGIGTPVRREPPARTAHHAPRKGTRSPATRAIRAGRAFFADLTWRAVKSRSLAEPIFADRPSRAVSQPVLDSFPHGVRGRCVQPRVQHVVQSPKLCLHIGLALAAHLTADPLAVGCEPERDHPAPPARAGLMQPGV